jgi:hypothetical protein
VAQTQRCIQINQLLRIILMKGLQADVKGYHTGTRKYIVSMVDIFPFHFLLIVPRYPEIYNVLIITRSCMNTLNVNEIRYAASHPTCTNIQSQPHLVPARLVPTKI